MLIFELVLNTTKRKIIFQTAPYMPFDSFYVALLSEKYQKNEQNIFTLFGGFLQGFISLLGAWRNTKRASSVIYVLKKE